VSIEPLQAQLQAESQYVAPIPIESTIPSAPTYSVPSAPSMLYPSLGDYMGLELNEETIAQNMPEYVLATRQNASVCINKIIKVILILYKKIYLKGLII